MKNKPIGIFDSGIGGLTVFQNIMMKLPNESYIYIGDNNHCPYGDKTKEELYNYACAIIDYFIKEEVKLIVIACNTVSSNVLPMLALKYNNVKIIGIIESTTKLLLQTNAKKTLVIATKATIESHAYRKEINKGNENIVVSELMTPLLVPLIEAGDNAGIERALHNYLDQIINDFDSLILGCTHYCIAENLIRKIVGNKKIINSSDGVTKDVDEYLTKNNLKGNKKRIQIYTTGDVEQFVSSSSSFFSYENINPKKLKLD